MHVANIERRLPRAGRGLIRGRQVVAARDDHKDGHEDDHHSDSVLPVPATVTVVETLPISTIASSTELTTVTLISTVFSSVADSETSATPTSTGVSTAATTLVTSGSVVSTFTPVPSATLPSATPSTAQSSGTGAQANLSTTSASLSAGGIAGIIIGCLTVLAAIFLFVLRRRFIKERQRSTGSWVRRVGSISPFTFGEAEPKLSPAPQHQNLRPFQLGQDFDVESNRSSIPTVMPVPMAVQSPTSLYSSTTTAPSFGNRLPPSENPFEPTFPMSTTVLHSFTVSLPDELSVSIGEKLTVLRKFDDGWALCTRENDERGMVPMECLAFGAPSVTNSLGLSVEVRGSRRVSSLLPFGAASDITDN
ncbi:hypothetical protein BDN70DRAFT_878973 [Pholiota conissans]|uniref:SH3 domain-containing protein n=1 Tax=Pholiota conissans TaxID=109636 RepID=A0A9P5Z2W7_9AGAR|nr:hypothetical protein BDN70DRAFT_878973 [Pholiota conissans]